MLLLILESKASFKDEEIYLNTSNVTVNQMVLIGGILMTLI